MIQEVLKTEDVTEIDILLCEYEGHPSIMLQYDGFGGYYKMTVVTNDNPLSDEPVFGYGESVKELAIDLDKMSFKCLKTDSIREALQWVLDRLE